jgi:hypothetical protein
MSFLKYLTSTSDVISFSIAPRLQLNMDNGDYYDFHDFFNLFLETQVCNLRECLLEWLLRARGTGTGTGNRVQIPNIPAQVVLVPTHRSESTDALEEITLAESVDVEHDIKTSHTAKSDHIVLHTDADSITDLISLIPGEAVISVDKMRWCVHVGRVQDPAPQPYPGCMVTTNYRVVLLSPRRLGLRSIPTSPACKNEKNSEERDGPSGRFEGVQCSDSATHSRYGTPRYFSMTSVPLSSIFRLYVAQPRNVFCIVVKDFRVIRIVVSSGVSGGLKSAVNMTAVTSSSSGSSSSGSGSGPYINGAADESAALSDSSDSAVGGRTNSGAGIIQSDGGVSSGQNSMDNSAGRSSNSDVAGGTVGNAKHLNGTESDHRVGELSTNGSVGIDINNKMNEKIHRVNNSIGNHGDSYSDGTSHGNNMNKASSNGNGSASMPDSHYNMRDAIQNASNGSNTSSSSGNNNNNNNYNYSNNTNSNTASSNTITHNNSNINSSNSNNSNGANNILNQSNYRSTPHSINNGPLSPTRAESLVITLNRLCFQHPSKPVDKPFAFRYAIRLRHNGWSHSDILAEYRRQGLLEGVEWKV